MSTLANAAARLKATSRKRGRALPALWLMTDARRLPDPLPAVRRLPRGAGVIVRHTDADERRRVGTLVARICRQRGLICLIAGDWRLAAALRVDGLHMSEAQARRGGAAQLWRRTKRCLLTMASHGRGKRGAVPIKPDAVILAPVFRTASHPGRPSLGTLRLARFVRDTAVPVIALGGITTANARKIERCGAAGIAAIGGLS